MSRPLRSSSKIPLAKKITQTGAAPKPKPTGGRGKTDEGQRTLSDIAILEPCDIEGTIPAHPAAIGKILAEAKFNRCKEITKLGRFRFKLVLDAKEAYTSLEGVNFEKYNLKLFVPASSTETICYVRGVPSDFKEEEIRNNIETEVPVLKVERIKWKDGDKLVDTSRLKVTVKGKQVPEMVKIYGCAFHMELYVFPVKQCQRCWRFGHKMKFCQANQRCRKCSRVHSQEECPNQKRCANCKKEHEADSKFCEERQRRENIINTMKKERKTYAEVESRYPKLTNRFEILDVDVEYPEMDTGASGSSTGEINTDPARPVPARPIPARPIPARPIPAMREGSWSQALTSQDSTGQIEGNARVTHNEEMVENVFNATLVESIVAQVRQELIRQLRIKIWLKPLIELRDEISNRIRTSGSSLDVDQLILQIFGRINEIIEGEGQSNRETRNSEDSRIVQENRNGAE